MPLLGSAPVQKYSNVLVLDCIKQSRIRNVFITVVLVFVNLNYMHTIKNINGSNVYLIILLI